MWHWGRNSKEGSEHYLNGVQYPMEVQLFHWNTKYANYKTASSYADGLAAVSFFHEVSSEDNPAISKQIRVLEELIQSLPKRHFVGWPNWEREFPTSSLSQLLPAEGLDASDDYFYYNGSLTLPNTTILTTTNNIDHNSNVECKLSTPATATSTRRQPEGKSSKNEKKCFGRRGGW